MRCHRAPHLGAAAALLLAAWGCARPPKISSTVEITRKSPDIVLVMLRIKNLEDRATTPIAPDVTVQTRSGQTWDKPIAAIHPAAFVLNRREQRDMFKVLHTNAELVRGTLTIKEQENGNVLVSQRFEKAVTSPPQVPSTAAPATPQPPGK